jgi:hypothetical protein
LALPWLPAAGPLIVIIDDTLCRKHGKGICGASMHHDPLLSSGRKPFFSFGHVWVVLALWVPLPMGATRGFALPLLFRLYRSTKRGGQADAPSRPTRGRRLQAAQTAHTQGERPTKLELAREMLAIVAQWAGPRSVYAVADSLYAGRTLLEQRPANVHVISRLRMDAALWTPPPPRRKGQTGRPRRRGVRLPTPTALAAAGRRWRTISVTIYGRTVTTQVITCRALWYVALRDQPVRIVVVHDPTGKRKDEAFFCTDSGVTEGFLLETYARRWTLEVTFHDAKQSLGFEDAQSQTARAVLRTAPLAGIGYDLVLLWAARHSQAGRPLPAVTRPWYRAKVAPSFLDMLVGLQQEEERRGLSHPPLPRRRTQNPCPQCQHTLSASA